MSELTLGSLFDGSGGFPLGGILNGITPLWASEIEPFPICVTSKRIPLMKHYGDISTLNGANMIPVDIITFGSPCQDMSIAGKRQGLNGSRSNLFYEAIRIVREMRLKTNGEYPKYIVWENVTGAFSSNKGEDFRRVLEEICTIKDTKYVIPKPDTGKWERAGSIVGEDFSVAWRVFDAQYWGVPQRRKRIYLVADFTSRCAGKVLFESKSLSRNFDKSESSQQETSCSFRNGIGKTNNDELLVFENHSQDLRFRGPLNISPTVSSTYGTGGNNQPFIVNSKCFDVRFTSENTKVARHNCYETSISRTIDTGGSVPDSNQGGVAILCKDVYGISKRALSQGFNTTREFKFDVNVEPTIVSSGANGVAHSVFTTSKSSYHTIADENIANTLVATDYKDPPTIAEEPDYIVRRLTPLECARLQGFPDFWCKNLETENPTEEDVAFWREVFETKRRIDGKKKSKTDNQIVKWLKNPYSDTAEYKMWGNGVALPCVEFVLSGIRNLFYNNNNKRSE